MPGDEHVGFDDVGSGCAGKQRGLARAFGLAETGGRGAQASHVVEIQDLRGRHGDAASDQRPLPPDLPRGAMRITGVPTGRRVCGAWGIG